MRKKGFSADYPDLAVTCLSFRRPGPAVQRVGEIPETAWPELLQWTDRKGLSLYLAERMTEGGLELRPELKSRREKNCRRLARLREEAAWVLDLFQAAGLRATLLKGFTLEPHFVPSAELRAQYDLDFFLAQQDAACAHRLLRERGYETFLEWGEAANHLPALFRKTGWEFRGDYFDLDIPIVIDLHYRLWNPEFERIRVEWEAGFPFSMADRLACVVLHAMRHVFRGSLRLSHLYELAYFLEHHSEDACFWQGWRHDKLMTTAFALASRVFSCRLPQDIPVLPREVMVWLLRFSHTVIRQERSGKCEALLQLALVEGWKDRAVVLRRRLLPLGLPGPVDAVYLRKEQLTLKRRLLSKARLARYVLGRASHHLRSFFGFAWAAARWLWDLA